MNRAHKNAWFGFGFSIIATILMLFIFALTVSRSFQTFPWIFGFTGAAALIFSILLFCSIVFRGRQLGDIDADERDRQIKNAAIKIAFAFVWPILILSNIVTIYFAGVTGPVPAILFAFIHLSVFVFSATIYFLSILTIYKSEGGAA
jgi:hypothetical protein